MSVRFYTSKWKWSAENSEEELEVSSIRGESEGTLAFAMHVINKEYEFRVK